MNLTPFSVGNDCYQGALVLCPPVGVVLKGYDGQKQLLPPSIVKCLTSFSDCMNVWNTQECITN